MIPSWTNRLKMVFKKLFGPTSSDQQVFTLPSCSLPSQYRSLLPARDTKAEELVRLERSSRRIRNVVLALVAILIIVVVGIVSLVAVTLFHYGTQEQFQLLSADISGDQSALVDHITTIDLSQSSMAKNYHYQVRPTGSQCVSRCLEFSAFKFKAICDRGRCRCRDKAYSEDTCLPRFGKCAIQLIPAGQGYDSLQVLYNNKAEPVYACSPHALTSASSPVSGNGFQKSSDGGKVVRLRADNIDVADKARQRRTESIEEMRKVEIVRKIFHKEENSESEKTRTNSIVSDKKGDDFPTARESSVSQAVQTQSKPKHLLTELKHRHLKAPENPKDESNTASEHSSFGSHKASLKKLATTKHKKLAFDSTTPPVQSMSTTYPFSLHQKLTAAQPEQSSPEINNTSVAQEEVSPLQSTLTPTAIEGSRVHVISVHSGSRGSSRHALTNVTVLSSLQQSIVLVLVSYGGRHWSIEVDDTLKIDEILLISNHRVSATSVSFSKRHERGSRAFNKIDTAVPSPSKPMSPVSHRSEPVVTRKLLRTGYGDDRRRGSTPLLLESITAMVGEIHSFIGVARADSVVYDAGFGLT